MQFPLVFFLILFSEVLSQQPTCTPRNFQLNDASKGKWYLLPDGSMQYEIDHCQLRRFNSSQAAECLGGANLLMMGASVTRYLYLTLTYFLTHGRWPMKFTKSHHPSYPRSMVWEKDHSSFLEFFQETNRALTKENRSSEICDCYRVSHANWTEILRRNMENRFYRYIPNGNLNDQDHDVRVSYIAFGSYTIRGHKKLSFYPRNESFLDFTQSINDEFCPINKFDNWKGNGDRPTIIPYRGECGKRREEFHNTLDTVDFPPFFEPTLPDCDKIHEFPETNECQRFEREVFQGMGVTHVMLNTGWHSSVRSLHPSFLPKLVDAAKRYMTPMKSSKMKLSKVVWRSCSYGETHEEGESVVHEFRKSEGLGAEDFDFFDIKGMTKALKEYLTANKMAKKNQQPHPYITHFFQPHPRLFYKEHLDDLYAGKIHYGSGYVDEGVHFEPWVNTEIWTTFLNAVCY
eukprot:gene6101-6567_t